MPSSMPTLSLRLAGRVAVVVITLCLLGSISGCGGVNALVSLGFSGVSAFATLTNSTAATSTITVSNIGFADAQIKGISIAGSSAFTETNTCPTNLKVGASCPIVISYVSSTAGSFAAILTVSDNGPFGGVVQTQLTATTAVPSPALAVSTSTLTFASLTAGTTSTQQTVTLTDTGTAPLTLSSVALTGAGANLFRLSNGCSSMLAVGASCAVGVSFAPKIQGSYAAAVAITDNAMPASQLVALAGTATASKITIDTTVGTDWKINNGAMTYDFNSVTGHVFGMNLVGFADTLVDATSLSSNGQPQGLYMDNSGFGTPTPTANYQNTGSYLDWWVTYPSSSTNAYTYSEHSS